MRRLLRPLGLVLVIFALLAAVPATAAAQQSLSLHVGGFVVQGEDARDEDDVLVNNLGIFLFDVEDFNGATFGADWLIQLHPNLEAGLGIGFYRKTVPSIYVDFVEDDGTEIEQDLRLRVIPFTATVRFLPLGREAAVQPYIGAGVGVFAYRYSESGEFIDEEGFVGPNRFVGSGTTAGPVVLGGARFPVGPWDIGGEIRYQNATGDLPEDEFFGPKIDLGGFSYLVNFNIRF